MEPNLFRQPAPALAAAIGIAFLSYRANANAARSLGVPISAIALIIAGALALGGFGGSERNNFRVALELNIGYGNCLVGGDSRGCFLVGETVLGRVIEAPPGT